MNTEAHFKTVSAEETYALGERIGKGLKGTELVLLCGPLGAGKTLMTKGIAASLGIDPGEVVSPTFTIMNCYEGDHTIFHIDLYRLGEKLRNHSDGLPEIDDNLDEGVIIVEWGQFLPSLYFRLKNTLHINFNVIDENTRQVDIETH